MLCLLPHGLSSIRNPPKTFLIKAAITYQGLQRIERYPVPDAALREAVLNALVHRDYAVGAPVQIRVYEDRLKIWNPAVLPEGWTLKNLLEDHASTPFNPDVANAFFRAGEIETWGRGIQRIYEACENAGAPAPIIDYKPNDLWLEFPFSPAYLKAIASTFQAEAPVTPQVTPPVTPQVTPQVIALLRVLKGEMNREQLQQALNLRARKNFRLIYLIPSLQSGLIEYTIPEKPTSRFQKYRLTEQGRALLSKTNRL